jgi:hypothetical protein
MGISFLINVVVLAVVIGSVLLFFAIRGNK